MQLIIGGNIIKRKRKKKIKDAEEVPAGGERTTRRWPFIVNTGVAH